MGIGRNEKCPCGSGLKYKKCCIDRKDDLDFLNPENFKINFKQLKHGAKIKHCLHPNQGECSEKIIGAHSIQNNKILKSIADNGKLYMPYPKPDNPFEIITEWGRKEATVFTGFCGYHDNELFKPIENFDFNYTNEHIFLHTYRAFAVSYHRKLENLKFGEKIYQKRPSLVTSENFLDLFAGERLAISDLNKVKEDFDKAILTKDYSLLNYEVWTFEKSVNFAASSFTVVTRDLKGNKIQDLADTTAKMKHLFFSIFPENNKTYCIFSWLKENDDVYLNYMRELSNKTDSEKIAYLNNLIPSESDNIVINPTSWNNLEKHQQEEFSMYIWRMNLLMEIIDSEDEIDIFDPPSYNLFDL